MERVNKTAKGQQGIAVQGIIGVLPLFPALDQGTFRQHLHMVGQGGLGNLKMFQQIAGAQFPLSQKLDNLHPMTVTQGFAHQRCIYCIHRNTSFPNGLRQRPIDYYQYDKYIVGIKSIFVNMIILQ